jgi:hypothetical protein
MSRITLSMFVVAMAALVFMAGPASAQQANADAVLKAVPQGMHVVAVVKDIHAADVKVGKFLASFLPPMLMQQMPPGGPQPLQIVLSNLIDDPTLIKQGSSLVFCTRFAGEEMEPSMMLLLELNDFKAFAEGVKPDANGLYDVNGLTCAPYCGMTAFFPDPDNAAEMLKAAGGIKLTADQKTLWTAGDAFALVDLAGLIKTLAPLYEKEHAKQLDEIKALKAAEGGAKQAEAKMAEVKMMEEFWAMGRQLDWAAVGAALPGTGLDVQMAAAVRPGTDMAAYLNGHAALAQMPMPGLPNVQNNWAAFWWSFDGRKVGQAMADVVGLAKRALAMRAKNMPPDGEVMDGVRIGPDDQAAGGVGGPLDFKAVLPMFEKLEKLLRDNADLIPGNGAALAMAGADGTLFNSLSAMKVGDRAAYDKFVDTMTKLQKEWVDLSMGMLADAGEKAPFKMDMTLERNARQIGELAVDLQKLKFIFPEDAAAVPGQPNVGKMLKGMFGGDTVNTWMTHSDAWLLSQVGPNPNHLAELAKTVGVAGGLAALPDIKALRAHTLKDANVIGYVSMATYMNLVMGAMMQAMAQQPMQMPPVNLAMLKAKSAFSAAAGRDRIAGRLFIPTEEFRLIVSNGMMMIMQMQMMQPPMQAPDNGGGNNGAQPPIM